MRKLLLIVLAYVLSGCQQNQDVKTNEKYDNDTTGVSYVMNTLCLDSLVFIGEFMKGKIYEGGFSGLTYIPNTEFEFFVLNDRGPNTSFFDKENTVLFPLPDYSQKIIRLKYINNKFSIISIHEIKGPDGIPVSGLPASRESDANKEIPVINAKGTKASNKRLKFDFEGISIDANGDLWLADEYRPSVLLVDGKTFQIKKIFSAEKDSITKQANLPHSFTLRQANRGFEGIAVTPNGKILAILQSPLETPELFDSVPNRLLRILHLDPLTGKTKTFGYELSADIIDPKIGDMTAINEHEFLIIEHGKDSKGKVVNVFKINLEYATNIQEVQFNEGRSFEGLKNNAKAQYNGLILAQKSHLLNLIEAGYNSDYGKPEGLTIIDASTIAIVNDNDFGIDGVSGDIRQAKW